MARRSKNDPLAVDAYLATLPKAERDALEQFRKEARRRRVGYQTLINEVLARHVRKDVA